MGLGVGGEDWSWRPPGGMRKWARRRGNAPFMRQRMQGVCSGEEAAPGPRQGSELLASCVTLGDSRTAEFLTL